MSPRAALAVCHIQRPACELLTRLTGCSSFSRFCAAPLRWSHRRASGPRARSCDGSEDIALALGYIDPIAGGLEVSLVALDADERLAHLHSGHASGAAAHERIEYRLRLRILLQA